MDDYRSPADAGFAQYLIGVLDRMNIHIDGRVPIAMHEDLDIIFKSLEDGVVELLLRDIRESLAIAIAARNRGKVGLGEECRLYPAANHPRSF